MIWHHFIQGIPNQPHPVASGTITLKYQLIATSLQDQLRVDWSSDGRMSNPHGQTTAITISHGNIIPGRSEVKNIAVHVTDSILRTLETRKSVVLFVPPCMPPK